MNKLRISISGTHGTGKSTLIKEIQKDEFFKEWKVITGVTRVAKEEQNLQINEDGNGLTQTYVLSIDIKNFIESRDTNSISDRCILDTFVYTKDLYKKEKLTLNVFSGIKSIYFELIRSYNVIFLIEPEFELISDKDRSDKIQYQSDILKLFRDELQTYTLHWRPKVVRLTGTVEQRISQIKETIKNLQNA